MTDFFSPIKSLAELITYQGFHFAPRSYWGETVSYFIYDTVKIGLLLVVINYLMAVTRYYFPTDRVRNLLTKRRWFGLDYLFAAILGAVTPFCSCSSIPLFIGFLGAGIPLGVTLTFLIASPLINESSLILFPALFGIKTTLIYNLVGILVAVAGGIVIQKLHLEKYVNEEFLGCGAKVKINAETNGQKISLKKLLVYWWQDGLKITKNIFPYVVMGVALGAVIHGFVPAALTEKYLATRSWWAVPLATVLGIPLYANSVSVVPVIEALIGKGIPLGTALAFMTSTVTLSVPEALILKKVMKPPLLIAFFGITTFGIMLIGSLFNLL